MSAARILLLTGAIVCFGLCAYAITTAVRRAKDRRDRDTHAATLR